MGEAAVTRAVRLRVFLTAGAGAQRRSTAGAIGGYGLLRCQSETGDRLLPGSSILEQKAQATVLVALPCSSQGLTAPGPGCVSSARHKGTHHLPARQCCVLLHRTLGDLTHGNTM